MVELVQALLRNAVALRGGEDSASGFLRSGELR
jgi:hypothetical protein